MNLWFSIDRSWLGNKSLWVSSMGLATVMRVDRNVHEVVSVFPVLWNKRLFELLMNLWFSIDRSWLGNKSLWVSSMGLATIVRINCDIHEIIGILSVFGNQWFLKLLMDLRLGIN